MFSERKIAQIAAYFAKAEGGRIPVLKLIKLMYLSDRESLNRHGDPLTFDEMYCLKHGPVLSNTLNYVNGLIESAPGGWDHWMNDREDREVEVKSSNIKRVDLDELSEADIEILEIVWKNFGHMGKWEIRDYTHEHCPEWKSPQEGGRLPLEYRDILNALGKSPQQIEHTEREINSGNYLEKVFAEL